MGYLDWADRHWPVQRGPMSQAQPSLAQILQNSSLVDWMYEPEFMDPSAAVATATTESDPPLLASSGAHPLVYSKQPIGVGDVPPRSQNVQRILQAPTPSPTPAAPVPWSTTAAGIGLGFIVPKGTLLTPQVEAHIRRQFARWGYPRSRADGEIEIGIGDGWRITPQPTPSSPLP